MSEATATTAAREATSRRDGWRRPLAWRRPPVVPGWLAPVCGALMLLLGTLILTIDQGEIAGTDRRLRGFLVGVILIAWLLELAGLAWPRLIFFSIVSLAIAGLIALGWDLFAPIMLIGLVGWLTYTGTPREGVAALAIAIASLVPPFVIRWENQEDWISWVIGVVFAWVSMRALVLQQRTLAQLRAAQAEIARQSAAAERRRIARELHDVIAHSLAITMLHLTGARHILARDPQRAAEALAEAEQTGRQSLADIRRTVGLLAEQDDTKPQPLIAPLPGAGDLPDLVAGYAQAGLDVSLTVVGDLERIPPTFGLDLYRIAQEALANAAKHAPGARVAVALTLSDDLLSLCVADSGPGPDGRAIVPASGAAGGSGLGLVGMRERVARLGGEFVTGRNGAGWLVECTIPLASASREADETPNGSAA